MKTLIFILLKIGEIISYLLILTLVAYLIIRIFNVTELPYWYNYAVGGWCVIIISLWHKFYWNCLKKWIADNWILAEKYYNKLKK